MIPKRILFAVTGLLWLSTGVFADTFPLVLKDGDNLMHIGNNKGDYDNVTHEVSFPDGVNTNQFNLGSSGDMTTVSDDGAGSSATSLVTENHVALVVAAAGHPAVTLVTNSVGWLSLVPVTQVLTALAVNLSSANDIQGVLPDANVANDITLDNITQITTRPHSSTTGQGADDHHNESHTVASHSDTTATGAELETLTDASNADALHSHTDNDTQLTQEQVEDFAGALVANATGTHTGIAITYQDATADMDFVVDHDGIDGVSTSDHHVLYTDAEALAAAEAETTFDHAGVVSATGRYITADTADSATASAGIILRDLGGETNDVKIFAETTASGMLFNINNNQNYRFFEGNVEIFTIRGLFPPRIGINNSTPLVTLDVDGDGAFTGDFDVGANADIVGTLDVGNDTTFIRDNSGGFNLHQFLNQSANAGSSVEIFLGTNGAVAGDPLIGFGNGVVGWSLGLDNSDSDKFVLSKSVNLGVSNVWAADGTTVAFANVITVAGTIDATTDITAGGDLVADAFLSTKGHARMAFKEIQVTVDADIVSDGFFVESFTITKSKILAIEFSVLETGGDVIMFVPNGGWEYNGTDFQVTDSTWSENDIVNALVVYLE